MVAPRTVLAHLRENFVGFILFGVITGAVSGCAGSHSVAASAPIYGRAWSATDSPSDSSLQRVIFGIALEPHSVRLASRGTGRVEGYGIHVVGDSVWVDTDKGARTFAMVDVDSLWVQRGTAALTVGILAAAPCAVFGALVGEFIATDPDSNGRPGRGPLGALIGAVLFGAPCGGLGAAIGSFFPRWRLEYARTAQAIIESA
jgi:hypothetical protein